MKKTMLVCLLFVMLSVTINAQNLSLDGSTTAIASSTYNSGYPAISAIDGDRKGLYWGNGGGWNDATRGVFPDILTITHNRVYPANHITLATLQDSFQNPIEPTSTQTCTLYGIKDFTVEGLDRTNTWVNLATVTGNTQCLVDLHFTTVRISAYKINVNASWDGLFSRIIEAEDYYDK